MTWSHRVVLGAAMSLIVVSQATGGDIQSDGKLVSTAASGPPLEVASAEVVENLNADWLDGVDASGFATIATLAAEVAQLQAQIDSLPKPLEVVDSLGAPVGDIATYFSDGALVLLEVPPVRVPLIVHRNDINFLGGLGSTIYYLLQDCAGPAYIRPLDVVGDPTMIEEMAGSTSYGLSDYVLFKAPDEMPASLPALSFWNQGINDCDPTSQTLDLVLAEEVQDLGLLPPFRIE